MIAGGFVLRTAFLTSKSFWMDEGFTAFLARTDLHGFITLIRTSEMNMALYYVLMRAWAHFGISEFWLRLFSVLASTATLPLVYLIGKQLADRHTGLLAASFLAVHPAHIAYAQEARSYALEVLLLTVAVLCVLRSVEKGSTVAWSGYLAASVGAIYCHVLAVLAGPATTVPIAASGKRLRTPPIAVLTLIAVVVTMPLVFFVFIKGDAVASWIPPLSRGALLESFRLVTIPKFGFLYVLTWGFALYSGLQSNQDSRRWILVFLICWLLLPGLLLAAISPYRPIFIARALLICVPAACLLAAFGLGALPRRGILIGFLVMMATSLHVAASQYRRVDAKEDWRGAAAYVCAHSAGHDLVEVVPAYGRFAFDYYRQLYGLPQDQFIYAAEPRGQSAYRTWLVVFGAVGKNSTGTTALASAMGTTSERCIVQSAQFNLVEVWLLQPCPIQPPR